MAIRLLQGSGGGGEPSQEVLHYPGERDGGLAQGDMMVMVRSHGILDTFEIGADRVDQRWKVREKSQK